MYKNEKNNSPSKLPQRVLVEQKSGTAVAVSTPSWLSLAKKSGKSHFPLSVVEQVYCRGIVSAKYDPKNTLEQQAFNRVDSFLHEGKAFELDQDLLMEIPKVPDGRKHMSIIKSAIKHHEERNKAQPTEEPQPTNEDIGHVVGRVIRKAIFGGGRKKPKSEAEQAQALVDRRARKKRVDNLAADIEHKQGRPQPQPQPKAHQSSQPQPQSSDENKPSERDVHKALYRKNLTREVKRRETEYKPTIDQHNPYKDLPGPNDISGGTANQRRKKWSRNLPLVKSPRA